MTASEDFSHEYLEYLSSLIAQLDRELISKFADLLLTSRDSGSTTFFLGNGGSASTATHFVNDVSLGSRQFDKPFRAISLCDNQAVITEEMTPQDIKRQLELVETGKMSVKVEDEDFSLYKINQ